MPLSRVKTQLVRYNEPLELEKEPTPETPDDGSAKLYFKDDDNLYKKTEDGVEQRVGGDLNALRTDLENQIKAAGQDNTADIFTNFVKDMEDHGKTSLHTERGFVDELEASNDMIDESNSSGFKYDSTGDFYTNQLGESGISTKDYNTEAEYISENITKETLGTSTVSIVTESEIVTDNGYDGFTEETNPDPRTNNLNPNPNTVTTRKGVQIGAAIAQPFMILEEGGTIDKFSLFLRRSGSSSGQVTLHIVDFVKNTIGQSGNPSRFDGTPLGAPIFSMTRNCADVSNALLPGFDINNDESHLKFQTNGGDSGIYTGAGGFVDFEVPQAQKPLRFTERHLYAMMLTGGQPTTSEDQLQWLLDTKPSIRNSDPRVSPNEARGLGRLTNFTAGNSNTQPLSVAYGNFVHRSGRPGNFIFNIFGTRSRAVITSGTWPTDLIGAKISVDGGITFKNIIARKSDTELILEDDGNVPITGTNVDYIIRKHEFSNGGFGFTTTSANNSEYLIRNTEPLYTFGLSNELNGGATNSGGSFLKPRDPNNDKIDVLTEGRVINILSDIGPTVLTKAEFFIYLDTQSGSTPLPEGTVRAELQVGTGDFTLQGGNNQIGVNNVGYVPVDAWTVDTNVGTSNENIKTKHGFGGNSSVTSSNGIVLARSDETIFMKDIERRSLQSISASDMQAIKITFNFTKNPVILYSDISYVLTLVAEGVNNNEDGGSGSTLDIQQSGFKIYGKKVPRGFDYTTDKFISVVDKETEIQNTSNWKTVTPILVDETVKSSENKKSDITNVTSITNTFNINHFNSNSLSGTDFLFGSRNKKYVGQTFIYGNQTSFQNIKIKKTGNGTPGNIRYFIYYQQDGKPIGDPIIKSSNDILATNITTTYQTFNETMVEFSTSNNLSSNVLGTNESRYVLIIEHLGNSDVDCYALDGGTPSVNSGTIKEICSTYSTDESAQIESRPYYWLGFDPGSGFGDGTEVKIFNRASSVWRTIVKNDGNVWKFNSFTKDYTKLLLPFEGDEGSTSFTDSTGRHTITSNSVTEIKGRYGFHGGGIRFEGSVFSGNALYQKLTLEDFDSGTIESLTNYIYKESNSVSFTGQMICQIYHSHPSKDSPFGLPIVTANETVDISTISTFSILPGPSGGRALGQKLVWTFPQNFTLTPKVFNQNTDGRTGKDRDVWMCFRLLNHGVSGGGVSALKFSGNSSGDSKYTRLSNATNNNSASSPFEINEAEVDANHNGQFNSNFSLTGSMRYELKLNTTPYITQPASNTARFTGSGNKAGETSSNDYKPAVKFNGRLSTEVSDDFTLATDDFTVDFWYNHKRHYAGGLFTVNAFDIPFTIHNANSQYRTTQQLYLRFGGPGSLTPTIHYFDTNGNEIVQQYGLWTSTNANSELHWNFSDQNPSHHWAVVRHNNKIKLYIDGTEAPLIRYWNRLEYEKVFPTNLGITNAKITLGGQIPGTVRTPDTDFAEWIPNFDLNHNDVSRSGRSVNFGNINNQYISHTYNPSGSGGNVRTSLDNIRIRKTGNGTPGNIILKIYPNENRGGINSLSSGPYNRKENTFLGDPELISSTVLTPSQITNSFQNFSFSMDSGNLNTSPGNFLTYNIAARGGGGRNFVLEHEDSATVSSGENAPYQVEGGTNVNSLAPLNGWTIPAHTGNKPCNGYMQEFRFTNGKALWKNNFLPPGTRSSFVSANSTQPTSTFTGTNAPENNLLSAVSKAIELEDNRMTKDDLESITEAEFVSTGGFNFNINKLFRGFTLLSKYNRTESSVNEYSINFVSDDEAVDIKSKQWTGTNGTPAAPTSSPDIIYLFVVDEQTTGTPQYAVTRNGTNYINVTFDATWRFDGTKTVRRATIDVSSLPAGTDPRLRVTNQVNEQYKLHAVGLQTRS